MNVELKDETIKVMRDITALISEKAKVHDISKSMVTFTRKEIGAFSGITENTVRSIMKELTEAGYVGKVSGSNGKTMEYRLIRNEAYDLVEPCESEVTRLKAHKNSQLKGI